MQALGGGTRRAGIRFQDMNLSAGLRVSDLRPTGRHGADAVYSARVSSAKPLVAHRKFRVGFRLGNSGTVERSVKLFRQGEHG
jgi:hypothetical protein